MIGCAVGNGISLMDLADRFGTPLIVYDLGKVEENYKAIRDNLGARVLYSIKANPNLAILTFLRKLGSGADAASPGEIFLALKAGFEPGDILYTGAFRSLDDIKYGIEAGVLFNFDSRREFERALSLGYRPRTVFFRVDLGYGRGFAPGVVLAGEESKFGMFLEDAIDAYRLAKSVGVEEFGIHAMMGSNVLDPDYFIRIAELLKEYAETIEYRVGIKITYFDMGGGFGIPYRPDEKPLDLNRLRILRSFFPGELWVEPGRFIVGNAGYLVTRVTEVKRKGSKTYVGVDVGMNVLIRPMLYGAYHHVITCNDSGEREVVDVVGPICENTDKLAVNRELPRVNEGDILVILNAGAYVYSMSSNYNGRPRPAEVVVYGNEYAVARFREPLESLVAGQVVPGFI
ncbi:diaminopimelate decarboxylase [Vulcanisaeta sp. JCM 14467]|uniref:diaminopimelate decarboxylase n=1 Tax=Vulcanisaeta sp. JCM 14467 TaxID=1295370 RepID=UPI000B277BFD|nr:diaminopimelate decarboxylase [Vulcanisaeta sp. JCM 14467]